MAIFVNKEVVKARAIARKRGFTLHQQYVDGYARCIDFAEKTGISFLEKCSGKSDRGVNFFVSKACQTFQYHALNKMNPDYCYRQAVETVSSYEKCLSM